MTDYGSPWHRNRFEQSSTGARRLCRRKPRLSRLGRRIRLEALERRELLTAPSAVYFGGYAIAYAPEPTGPVDPVEYIQNHNPPRTFSWGGWDLHRTFGEGHTGELTVPLSITGLAKQHVDYELYGQVSEFNLAGDTYVSDLFLINVSAPSVQAWRVR
jgi:hypothetical protein